MCDFLQPTVLVDARKRDDLLLQVKLTPELLRDFAAGRDVELPILALLTNHQFLAMHWAQLSDT